MSRTSVTFVHRREKGKSRTEISALVTIIPRKGEYITIDDTTYGVINVTHKFKLSISAMLEYVEITLD
jgi:hypothetical protein